MTLVFNGSYRVSSNGGLVEFIPPQEPSPGAQNKPEIKILQAEFGDGYSQAAPAGLNNVRSVLTLQWDYLEGCERDGIIKFLECRGGTEPFIFRLPKDRQWAMTDEQISRFVYTCADWSDTAIEAGLYNVNATFRQWFGNATSQRRLEIVA
jgi:phage-related protein